MIDILGKTKEIVKKRIVNGAAVYISEDFIDVAKAELTLQGMRISYLQRFPVLENIKNLSYTQAKDEIDSVLEKAFGENDKPYRVAANLKNEYFILRRFSLKDIPEAELKKAILFEAQRYVPYQMEDLTFEFRKCAKKEGVAEIAFAGAETRNINNLIEYFKGRNILSSVIEPIPILVTRALKLEGKLKKNASYASIHYEPINKIIVTGIWRGLPYFFREISIFSGEEEFKTTELAYPPLKDVWSVVGNEILTVLTYLKKETKADIDKIFISGFSPFPEEAALSEELGSPAERLSLSYFKGISAENKDRFLPTLSLLYDALHGPFLNLAAKETAYRDLWTFRPVVKKALFFLGGIMLLHILLAGANLAQSGKIRELTKKFNAYKAVKPNVSREEVFKYKDLLEEKVRFVNNALAGKVYLTEKLNALAEDTSPNAWVDVINFQNQIGLEVKSILKINGAIYAFQEEGVREINDMLERMRNDAAMMDGFKEIKLVSAKKKIIAEKEITEFEFILK